MNAAEQHLEQLLAELTPTSEGQRFHGALSALHSAGVLDDDAAKRWRTRATAAQAPWLEPDELAALETGTGHALIRGPGLSREEADARAAARLADHERIARRGRARRVHTAPTVSRRDGLAIVAVITRTECTEVRFHCVAGARGDDDLAALVALLERLVPPPLTDDAGTAYTLVSERPVGAHVAGGPPDPARPLVVSGGWRYQPPAPDAATTFTVRGAQFRVAP
ncbi:hypothetical protein C8N24_0044 [Solirubrobacter pauli]|uniref:Uncharacterized protein n=1 Tax=Solirubrobacter pauli TaxID=166793 RepID=A0A660L7K4_9ACTN|nr:hypothetical protein [Solirubrobacter pauli]RKQ90245.1 hypothetical protein C8N24_0044 [Solirubrobacter pauli]